VSEAFAGDLRVDAAREHVHRMGVLKIAKPIRRTPRRATNFCQS
jgi:hypothetical protein